MTPDLLATFTANILRITDPSDADLAPLELRPRQGRGHGRRLPLLHVIPAWNPEGRPTQAGLNVALREGLEYDVLVAGATFTLGSAHSPDFAWAEETLVVNGLTDADAAAIAAVHGQPALWRIAAGVLTVLRAGDATTLAERDVECSPLTRRPCVMPSSQAAAGRLCVRPGGGEASASNPATALWVRDRDDLLTVLGCDGCDSGRRDDPGLRQSLSPETWPVVSRYGRPHPGRPGPT